MRKNIPANSLYRLFTVQNTTLNFTFKQFKQKITIFQVNLKMLEILKLWYNEGERNLYKYQCSIISWMRQIIKWIWLHCSISTFKTWLRGQNYYTLVISKHIVTSFVKQGHNLCSIVERAGSHHKPDACHLARKRTGL